MTSVRVPQVRIAEGAADADRRRCLGHRIRLERAAGLDIRS